jgi:hypothetical protein
MAISLIPQKKKKREIGFNIGGFLSAYKEMRPVLITFLVLVVSWAGLLIWANILERDIQRMRDEQSAILSAVEQGEIVEVQKFAGRIRALSSIISEQTKISGLFEEFENSIHQHVSIESFDLTISSRVLNVTGIAGDFEALAQQFVIWEGKTDFIESVDLAGFSRTAEGSVDFNVYIVVKPNYLK